MKNHDLTSLRCFKAIYDSRSLTRTATTLGLSKAAISKRLDHLEADLGYKLFLRTTRSVSTTADAEKIIQDLSEVLDKLDSLKSKVKRETKLSRKVRITCISSMAQRMVGDLVAEFLAQHPEASVELKVTDSVLDFVENDLDIAIRINPSKNSSLVGRKVGSYSLALVASPNYLSKHKTPKSLEDLLELEFISLDQHLQAFPKELRTQLHKSRRIDTNDSALITQLLLRGKGIGLRSSWDVKGLIKEKKLIHVLPEAVSQGQGDIWVLSSREKLSSTMVRSFYEFLVSRLEHWLE